MRRFKFLVCKEIGCPHPRYLDMYLTPGMYADWIDFMQWYGEKMNDKTPGN